MLFQMLVSFQSSPNSLSKTASLSSHSSPLALSPVTLTAQPTQHHHYITAQPSKTSGSGTSKKIPSTPPLPAALHRLGEIKHDLNLETSAVFVTTPDGSRTKFDSTGLTPRDFPPAGKMTTVDSNCNFSYFSVSEDATTGDADRTLTESGDDTPSFQSSNVQEPSQKSGNNGAINTTTTTDYCEYEEEEEDVFFADEKSAIHRLIFSLIAHVQALGINQTNLRPNFFQSKAFGLFAHFSMTMSFQNEALNFIRGANLSLVIF